MMSDEDLEGDFKTSFKIISNTQDIPFSYERSKDGLLTTTASDIKLDRAVDAELIEIIERNIPYKQIIYRGGPEAIRDGELKILQPSKDGAGLIDVRIGAFKCQRCGDETYIPQTNGKLIEPFECQNEDCGRKGPFKPLFPTELNKPVWKLPFAALKCSAVGVYEDIYNYIREYLVLKPEEYHLMTLWIMASYLVDNFETVPYLLFIAPKESGKSQAMRILSQLAYRAFLAASVTPSALFRAIELWKVTLLIDEAEYQIKTDTESGQALYETLNMGYKRDSFALRVEGENRIPARFDVFGFKAIASTKIFLPTLESRSIIINMSQGKPKEIIIDALRADIIRSELLYFKFFNLDELPITQPDSNSGRIIEIMTPLFTVAQIFKGMNGAKTAITFDEITTLLCDKVKEMETSRADEEHESNEAMIIEKIKVRRSEKNISLEQISRDLGWYNETDSANNKQASARIGRTLKAMGIKTHRTGKGVLVKMYEDGNDERIDAMIKRYLDKSEQEKGKEA